MSTNIEYLTKTWNPMHGCSQISDGCRSCWAKRMAQRQRGRNGYDADDPFRVVLRPERLEQPLRWKKPQGVGVCFMGDLFHRDVPFEYIWKTYDMMSAGAQLNGHKFFVLTKRPQRALEFYQWVKKGLDENLKNNKMIITWPVPSIHLGVSVENQETFNERWNFLKRIPAKVLWLSYEPALGPLVLPDDFLDLGNRAWVVVGSESGQGARPLHPSWVRKVRFDCVGAGVPIFIKQLHINGKLSKDPSEWPEDLRIRELPNV